MSVGRALIGVQYFKEAINQEGVIVSQFAGCFSLLRREVEQMKSRVAREERDRAREQAKEGVGYLFGRTVVLCVMYVLYGYERKNDSALTTSAMSLAHE